MKFVGRLDASAGSPPDLDAGRHGTCGPHVAIAPPTGFCGRPRAGLRAQLGRGGRSRGGAARAAHMQAKRGRQAQQHAPQLRIVRSLRMHLAGCQAPMLHGALLQVCATGCLRSLGVWGLRASTLGMQACCWGMSMTRPCLARPPASRLCQ